jgi:hypothetical protein
LFARSASVALSLLPSGRPKALDILAETVMPSLYGPKPVVAEAGASAFGAVETAVAAGVAFTSAAVDPMPTCCGPAGVATVMVPDFAGEAALAPAPAAPVAVAVAPTVVVRGGSTTLMLGIEAG